MNQWSHPNIVRGYLQVALTMWLFSSALGYGKESAKPGFTMPPVSPKEDLRRKPQVVSGREESWYKPSFALGFGAGFPTLMSIEGYGFVGRYLAVRGFFMPPIPFGIRVELPSDVISAKQGLAVANPPFDVNFKGRYGASYGADMMVFPFAGSFFVGAGLYERRLRLEGNAESGILACSVIEAAKEPPCGNENARIETQTRLVIKADITTSSLVNSLGAGWLVRFWDSAYMTFQFGYAKPWNIDRRVSVSATLDSPSSAPTEITGALADIRMEKEDEMRTKVLQEIKNYDEKGQPILGLSFGIRL